LAKTLIEKENQNLKNEIKKKTKIINLLRKENQKLKADSINKKNSFKNFN
jgi:hypothetical protein